jgi:hypothetical protein
MQNRLLENMRRLYIQGNTSQSCTEWMTFRILAHIVEAVDMLLTRFKTPDIALTNKPYLTNFIVKNMEELQVPR